ncbi:MAG: class I SAM-dependent methyltransferase [Candidatus Heimdallarchaeota archaeon]|nr:class I SAM-dependent methyltransferase [Candidatus Heimdallarchaeota archaeon]
MNEFVDSNKKLWDGYADVHFNTPDAYGIEQLREKGNVLKSIEQEEVGNVKGKSLLHLQCHIGIDTLSWEKLGANCTGVDFSPKAIHYATQLSQEMGLNSTFVLSDIMKLVENYPNLGRYDIIFQSYGTLYWLPDIKQWARTITYYLKSGGFFYIVDSHPSAHIFDEEMHPDLKVKFNYFHDDKPLFFEEDGTYAVLDAKLEYKKEYGWQHSLSDIIMALLDEGLELEFLHEHEVCAWNIYPNMIKEGEWWVLPDNHARLPAMFSLKVKKP